LQYSSAAAVRADALPRETWSALFKSQGTKDPVQCARKLLNVAVTKRPTAIFASNDEMAAGVLTVARSTGLGVPEDLSVVGFDVAPLANQAWPALSASMCCWWAA